ncbi:MAG TPA: methyltransferase domain-containing protein [Verrucomicrobiae bacterium]|nr:methyltransferase domain-containing protein [Verrucomicrobiae bacterium]
MNPEEYNNLARVEQRHWFYVGKREIVRAWINRCHALQPTNLLVDCGAGTGIFVEEMRAFCRVLATDDFDESLQLLAARLGTASVVRGSCSALPLADNSTDVLTALDVIEHVQDDRAAMKEFFRVLRPGGIAVVTVPALMALWSDWDVSLRHHRRYSQRTLRAIIPNQFEILHLNYINVAVLPAVFLVRKFRALKQRLGLKSISRSEDRIPPAWLNGFLRRSFVWLACQRFVRFPAGVGLLVVLRKKPTGVVKN